MDQAQLALAVSMHELTKQQDAISNNLANINSTAFKRRAGGFEEFQHTLADALGSEKPLALPRYRESSDFAQGDFLRNDDPLSVAVIGEGFLKVRKPDTERFFFTRAGELAVGPNGRLMTRSGFEVLDENDKPINASQAAILHIAPRGEVSDKDTGTSLGRIGLFRFNDRHGLHPIGLGLFQQTARSGRPEVDAETTLTQGGLERSNVNSIQELVGMISVQRHFQSVSRALTAIETVNQQLINLASSA